MALDAAVHGPDRRHCKGNREGRIRGAVITRECIEDDPAHAQGIDEKVLGLSADPVSRTFWVFTDRSILEVLVRNEDRDVWRAKLEKGEYNDALQYATVSRRSHQSGRS